MGDHGLAHTWTSKTARRQKLKRKPWDSSLFTPAAVWDFRDEDLLTDQSKNKLGPTLKTLKNTKAKGETHLKFNQN